MDTNQGRHSRLRIGASFMLALMPIVGCSSSSNCTVSGQVSFNGKPLDEAVIIFRPVGSGHKAGGQAKIEGGSYTVDRIPVGNYSVWVLADRKTGRKVPVPDVEAGKRRDYDEEVVQFIPIKYNARTELQIAVVAGENHHDFDLTE